MGNYVRNLNCILIATCCALILFAACSAQNANAKEDPDQSGIVRKIIVQGSQRIEAGTVKTAVGAQAAKVKNISIIDNSLIGIC